MFNLYFSIYEKADKHIDVSVLDYITDMSKMFGEEAEEIDKLFSQAYLLLVAEEMKPGKNGLLCYNNDRKIDIVFRS